MSGCEVDVGRRGRYSNMYVLNLKVSFLPVKTSSFDHTNVWSPKLQWNARTDDPVHSLFWQLGTSPLHPPCVHLTSFTWWMLPGLPHLLLAVYYCECKQGGGGWGLPTCADMFYHTPLSFLLLPCRQYVPRQPQITIDFASIEGAVYDVKPSHDTSTVQKNSSCQE